MKIVGFGAYSKVFVRNARSRHVYKVYNDQDSLDVLEHEYLVLQICEHAFQGASPFVRGRLITGEHSPARTLRLDRYRATLHDFWHASIHQHGASYWNFCALLLPIAKALAAIHELGIIHRDIKPANVLVSPMRSELPFVVLCDAGLSYVSPQHYKDKADIKERPGNMECSRFCTTPQFRAPETLDDCLSYDTAVDIWALGIVALWMLTSSYCVDTTSDATMFESMIALIGMPDIVRQQPSYSVAARRCRQQRRASHFSIEEIVETYPLKGSPSNALFIDLLRSMLTWDPSFRITADEVMSHAFFKEYQAKSAAAKQMIALFLLPLRFDVPFASCVNTNVYISARLKQYNLDL